MNKDTVLQCAKMAAAQQLAGLGYVADDVQNLINELTTVVVEAIVEVDQTKTAAK